MSNPSSPVSNLDSLHTPWLGPITANGRPELRLGTTDPDPADGPVRYLQRLLHDRGYDYVLVNGQFDLLTLAAVKDFQLRQTLTTPPSHTAHLTDDGTIDGTVVDDPLWEALLAGAPQTFTAQSGQPVLAACPLGTNQDFPPDLVIPGKSQPPQAIAAYQYTHFSPHSATWRTYPFRDDRGQLPQLRLGDADPEGSHDGPIRQLQAFLQDHGYYKGAVNGRFEQELHDVVVAYQNSHPSLLADGVINAADWAQLFREDRQDARVQETTQEIAIEIPSLATLESPPVLDARVVATIVDLSQGSAPPGDSPVGTLREPPTPASNHHPWLRLHATDDDLPNGPIRQLQRLLFVVGLGVPLTGIFDVATEQAVRRFQRTFPDLTDPPGEVGPDTWAKLEQEAAKPLDPFALLEAPESVTDSPTPLPTTPDRSLAWDDPLLASPGEPANAIAAPPIVASPIKIVDLAAPPPTIPAALPLLQKGQTDPAANGPIAHLQTLLNEYGYVLTVDGQFNEATFQAVSNFQYSHDLPPTGGVDRATWEVLMGQDTTDPNRAASPHEHHGLPNLAILDLSLPVPPSSPQASPTAESEVSLPTWDALMQDAPRGQAVDPGHPAPAIEPAATGLLAAVSPLDVSLPPELMALSSGDRDTGTVYSPPLSPGASPRPDPLIPSPTPPPPALALVDLYAQGDTPLTTSQQHALQWLSQQLPTATLTEFQQRWHIQGSGT